MLPYFLLFAIPGLAALNSLPTAARPKGSTIGWLCFGVLLTLIIGFRYRVGADWYTYIDMMQRVSGKPLVDAVVRGDPGYLLLNWLFTDSGFNVWTVNVVCGAIFCFGLFRFCRTQPHPWLTLLVAIPYLVVVVAMGYSRQAVAIGLALVALVALQERSILRFLGWIILAATFHKTAVLLIPIGILGYRRHNIWTMTLIGAVGFALFAYLLQASEQYFVSTYIQARYSSSGALIRIVMNLVPSVIFLAYRRRFLLDQDETRLWTLMAWCGLAFVPLLYMSPSSTAVDRMALYFIPIQLFVFGRLPLAWARSKAAYQELVAVVTLYSGTVLAVWLNFADTAFRWVPYQLFPVEALTGLSH